MLVAGADVGKSSLLTQTALAVAKGVRPEYLSDNCSASLKQDVVYYRIEDFPDELEGKYGQGKVFMGANIKWVLPEDLGGTNLNAFLNHVKLLAKTRLLLPLTTTRSMIGNTSRLRISKAETKEFSRLVL